VYYASAPCTNYVNISLARILFLTSLKSVGDSGENYRSVYSSIVLPTVTNRFEACKI
jgi:hypothetical protein